MIGWPVSTNPCSFTGTICLISQQNNQSSKQKNTHLHSESTMNTIRDLGHPESVVWVQAIIVSPASQRGVYMALTCILRGLGGCFCASSSLKCLHIKNKHSISPNCNGTQNIGPEWTIYCSWVGFQVSYVSLGVMRLKSRNRKWFPQDSTAS